MRNHCARAILPLALLLLSCALPMSAQDMTPAPGAVDQTSVIDAAGVLQPPRASIASTRNWPGDAVEVLRFRLVDAGSGDRLPTILSRLVVRRAAGCATDLNLVVAGASLWDGSTKLPLASVRVFADRIEMKFGVPEVFVKDSASALLTLRVYLRSDGGLPDGAPVSFAINSNTDAQAAAGASSTFSVTAGTTISSELFTVHVTPTQLSYAVIPRTVTRNVPFPLTVCATDGCGNIATNFTGSITIALDEGTGTLSTALPLKNAVAGVVSWSDLRYSMVGSFRLSVSSAGIGAFRSPNINSGSNADIAWTSTGALHHPRYYHTATLLPTGRVLVTGGRRNQGALLTCELFDAKDAGGVGAWTDAAEMLSRRERHTATLMPFHRVLVAGGIDGYPIRACEMYDWQSNQWLAIDSMIDVRYEHTATLLRDGRLLVAGSKNYDKGFTGCELFDLPMLRGKDDLPAAISSSMWRRTGSLHMGRGKHTATMLNDGRVLVTGGVSDYVPIASCEIYEPGTETWSDAAPMQVAREGHTATLLPDGRVLVTGGASYEETSCEVFDPLANGGRGAWTLLASMNMGRRAHAAALMRDGMLLVTGAWITGHGAQSCEIFESTSPASSTWKSVSSMISERSNHTLTSLADGRVLATGGEVYGFQEGSAECEIGDLKYVTAAELPPSPQALELAAPYPNPFRDRTSFALRGLAHGDLCITVTNELGQTVHAITIAVSSTGQTQWSWDGRAADGARVPSGTYHLRVATNDGRVLHRTVQVLR